MPDPLLVVDVQRGFINEFTQHIPGRIARLIDTRDFAPVLFTRFINTPNSPYQRLLQWHGSAEPPETLLAPELSGLADPQNVYDKLGLTGTPDQLSERLRRDRVEEISIVGIDTDMCVLKIAMDVFDSGIEPIILVDCCASTAGLQAHLAGLAILSRNIGPFQLRLTRLHEGYLTTPRGDPTPSSS
ncbi:MAG: cysteine hydrolase [Chloroflexota bacterium]|nr:cysteine hydrolase [Chloroflexota bacterium]